MLCSSFTADGGTFLSSVCYLQCTLLVDLKMGLLYINAILLGNCFQEVDQFC